MTWIQVNENNANLQLHVWASLWELPLPLEVPGWSLRSDPRWPQRGWWSARSWKVRKARSFKKVFYLPTFMKTSANLYYISAWKVSARWSCFNLHVVLTGFRLFHIKLTSVINFIRKRSRLLPVWLDRHISKSIKFLRSCRRQEKSSPPSPFDCCHPNCPVETKVSSINYLEKKLLLDYKQLILIQTFNTRPKDTRIGLNSARWKDINTC